MSIYGSSSYTPSYTPSSVVPSVSTFTLPPNPTTLTSTPFTCSQFTSGSKVDYCSELNKKLGLNISSICSKTGPEPRATWTDLIMSSISLEKAIDIAFINAYPPTGYTQMDPMTLKNTMLGYLVSAYYSLYYSWMYLCQASKVNSSISTALIPQFMLGLEAMYSLISNLSVVSPNYISLNAFSSVYIYGFEAIISKLSQLVTSFFHVTF